MQSVDVALEAGDEPGVAGDLAVRSVSDAVELRPDERLLLEHAAHKVDLLARIDDEPTTAPLTVKGSVGQLPEHPLVSGTRVTRGAIGIGFTSDDADATHAAMTAAGVEVDEILRGPGVPSMFGF